LSYQLLRNAFKATVGLYADFLVIRLQFEWRNGIVD
jgi:hypothetical protein